MTLQLCRASAASIELAGLKRNQSNKVSSRRWVAPETELDHQVKWSSINRMSSHQAKSTCLINQNLPPPRFGTRETPLSGWCSPSPSLFYSATNPASKSYRHAGFVAFRIVSGMRVPWLMNPGPLSNRNSRFVVCQRTNAPFRQR